MKNLNKVSEATRKGVVSLYYSISEDSVYTRDGKGRYYLTDLIRYNTEDEIEQTVKQFMSY